MNPLVPVNGDKLLIVSLSRTYDPLTGKGKNGQSLYDITRGDWPVSYTKAIQADYVLGVFKGVVVSVYEPIKSSWRQVAPPAQTKRYGFDAANTINPVPSGACYLNTDASLFVNMRPRLIDISIATREYNAIGVSIRSGHHTATPTIPVAASRHIILSSNPLQLYNWDSSYPFANSDIQYIENVIINNIKTNNRLKQVGHDVPCYFVNKSTFDKISKDNNALKDYIIIDNGRRFIIPSEPEGIVSTELLGLYYHDCCIKGINGPAIFVCPERILNHSYQKDFLYLLVKVMIHEYYHAYSYSEYDKTRYFSINLTILKWMEESCANAMTLSHLEQSTGAAAPEFKFAHKFMEEQPKEYCLGLVYHDLKLVDWDNWIYSGINALIKHSQIDDFINYVDNTPPANISAQKLQPLITTLFN